MVYLKNEKLRPSFLGPSYPPYHTGPYLEEYFFNKFNNIKLQCDKTYLDAFWTNIYCNRDYAGIDEVDIQEELNKLNNDNKYFTIVQHDDGVREFLPENTLIFSAGGNNTTGNVIPIPMICSKLPEELISTTTEKSIFASFVGSLTHPIRQNLAIEYDNNSDYIFLIRNWSNSIPLENLKMFIDVTLKSKFAFAPRGYGPTSFRLYEILQLNTVPVYISDYHYLPWTDEIDWSEFCVLISEHDIANVDKILKSITDETYEAMLKKGKEIYANFFTLDGVVDNIIKRISL